jgi:DNA-binding CsgD family transcriptional regulator
MRRISARAASAKSRSAGSESPPDLPAVVLADANGTVFEQNAAARRLLGDGSGKLCCDVIGSLPGAEELPCRNGCVRELFASGLEQTRCTRFSVDGRRYHLTCVPVDGVAVCTIGSESSASPEGWQLLTSREQDVLQLVAEGRTTAAIGRQLELSQSTVRTHIEHMFTKLNVTTRAALVFRAVKLGFLD